MTISHLTADEIKCEDCHFMDEQEQLAHMTKVDHNEDQAYPHYFLPQHPVFKHGTLFKYSDMCNCFCLVSCHKDTNQLVTRIVDPLGLVAPIIVTAKIQELRKHQIT